MELYFYEKGELRWRKEKWEYLYLKKKKKNPSYFVIFMWFLNTAQSSFDLALHVI
jgi:hypothetical protein